MSGPDRQTDKDAGDIVRIMLEASPDRLAGTLRHLAEHPQAGPATTQALQALPRLFGAARAPGVQMAVKALTLDLPEPAVVQICTSFARDLAEILNTP